MNLGANAITRWVRRALLILGGLAAVGAAWAAYDLQTGPGPALDLKPVPEPGPRPDLQPLELPRPRAVVEPALT